MKTTDLDNEALASAFEELGKEKYELQRENIFLKKEVKYWRYEAEKYERVWKEVKK